MAHYDIFRHHLALKYSAYGYALWDPDPGNLYPAVEIGDLGYIREGKFHRLFNVLLPAEDSSHADFGVPENYEQLELNPTKHISIGKLSPNNFCSAKVTSIPESERLAQGPDEIRKVTFSCPRKEGAVLYLPIDATGENTVKLADFGKWMVKHIDYWFAWARQHGWGIDRMEDIILVTGTHRARSWTNVAFPGGQEDSRALFGGKADNRDGMLTIKWEFSHESSRGVVLNCGPDGENLPEDQCIFIRGYRVTRKLRILPPRLKGAAGPNPDPKGRDEEPDLELIQIPSVPKYRDPLHILLEYIANEAPPNCEMILVHDNDLAQLDLDETYDSTLVDSLRSDVVLSHIRSLNPTVHNAWIDMSSTRNSASADTEYVRVATLSNFFENQFPLSKPPASQGFHVKAPFPQSERSWRHASLEHDLLERRSPPETISELSVLGSEDSPPSYMSDNSVSTLQPGSIKLPELGPLHPLALLYGSGGRSYESVPSYTSEVPHPRGGNLPWSSPGASTSNISFATSTASTSTVLDLPRTTQPHTRTFSHGDSRDSSANPGETSVVALRVQVLSCQNLEAKNRNGWSDPYVVVSLMGRKYKTPVCKRNLDPVYQAKDATFDFPIYIPLANKLSTLEFTVWNKGTFGKDNSLGNYALPIDQWFYGTAFAFKAPDNQDFLVNLKSSPYGTIRIKVGFVPPNSTSPPLDFERIYSDLMSAAQVLAPSVADKDHVGTVVLDIIRARDLPKWPNMTRLGWDMDPFVQVSIGELVQFTTVVLHDRNPMWDERLSFRVDKHDLSQAIRICVFDRNKVTRNEYVGGAEITIAILLERAAKKVPIPGFYPDDHPTIDDFELPLTPPEKSGRVYETIPTIYLRARYHSDAPINYQSTSERGTGHHL